MEEEKKHLLNVTMKRSEVLRPPKKFCLDFRYQKGCPYLDAEYIVNSICGPDSVIPVISPSTGLAGFSVGFDTADEVRPILNKLSEGMERPRGEIGQPLWGPTAKFTFDRPIPSLISQAQSLVSQPGVMAGL